MTVDRSAWPDDWQLIDEWQRRNSRLVYEDGFFNSTHPKLCTCGHSRGKHWNRGRDGRSHFANYCRECECKQYLRPFDAQRVCPECGRIFDLLDPVDSEEWAVGHDCETEGESGE